MRPTVNDLAREAGVSLATVDRVLNARPGVRQNTILSVNEAIRRIGFVRDQAAANLARSRSYRMAFVLPDTESQFVQTLVTALDLARPLASMARTEVVLCRFPAENPHALSSILAELPARGIAGVAIMAPETPVLRDAIRALRLAGLNVVALVSDLPNTGAEHFIGIDNRAAGHTAAVLMGRFLGANRPAQTPQSVMVISDSMSLRESIERRAGFDQQMQTAFPRIDVLPTVEAHGRADAMRQIIRETLRHSPGVSGIYLLGTGLRALTGTLAELAHPNLAHPHPMVVIAHELTPHARAALQAGNLDAVITQNTGHLVRSALRVLRAKADSAPIDQSQEQIRIEIVIRENLPALQDDAC